MSSTGKAGALSRIIAIVALVLLAPSGAARADDRGGGDYASLIRSALGEYDAGRYDEASALFRRAHELSPNARTYRGLGLTYYELRKYALAVEYLRAALADTRRSLTAQQRESTQRILRQAEGFVARVKVELQPLDAQLEVDGYAAELKDGELLLDAGSHELIARAEGHQEEHRRVDAIAGSSTAIQISLQGEPRATEAASAPSPAEAASRAQDTAAPPATAATSGGPGAGPFIVLGAGGALLIGSLVTGLIANGLHSDLEGRCPDDKCKDPDAADDKETGKTLVAATNVLLVSGLVVAAAGATWWILAPRDESAPQVAAACVPGACGATLRAHF
jgi:hypothetical protein